MVLLGFIVCGPFFLARFFYTVCRSCVANETIASAKTSSLYDSATYFLSEFRGDDPPSKGHKRGIAAHPLNNQTSTSPHPDTKPRCILPQA